MREFVKPNGEILRKWLKDNHFSYLEFSRKSLAEQKHIGIATVNDFVNEKRNVTPTVVRKISEITGIHFNSLIK